jgi:hypothetical protein
MIRFADNQLGEPDAECSVKRDVSIFYVRSYARLLNPHSR